MVVYCLRGDVFIGVGKVVLGGNLGSTLTFELGFSAQDPGLWGFFPVTAIS